MRILKKKAQHIIEDIWEWITNAVLPGAGIAIALAIIALVLRMEWV